MVEKLLEWYNYNHYTKKIKITTKEFKQKALEFSELPISEFCASKVWLQNLRKKHNIELNKQILINLAKKYILFISIQWD